MTTLRTERQFNNAFGGMKVPDTSSIECTCGTDRINAALNTHEPHGGDCLKTVAAEPMPERKRRELPPPDVEKRDYWGIRFVTGMIGMQHTIDPESGRNEILAGTIIGKLVRPLKEVQGRNGPITFADMVIEAPGETFDGVEAGMLCSYVLRAFFDQNRIQPGTVLEIIALPKEGNTNQFKVTVLD